MKQLDLSEKAMALAKDLSDTVEALRFGSPVTHVYNPLAYAWEGHSGYLRLAAQKRKKVVFLGMNPGPWGMAQTGVPFGEVHHVRDWMGIEGRIDRPAKENPKRPIAGFSCEKSEVSGRRLWGLFAERFGTAKEFFRDHFVANYCPLVFMEESGRNRTPDKLPVAETSPLQGACDRHLVALVRLLEPEWVIGVGGFAAACAERALAEGGGIRIGKILHPSPASPAANRDWSGQATSQMRALGIWD